MDFENFPEVVYHGTISLYKKSLLDGIKIERGDLDVDFGQGFYTTTNYQQAIDFAIKHSRSNNKFQRLKKDATYFSNPMIFEYKINKDKLAALQGIAYESPNEKWAEFIYNNRLGIDFLRSDCHNLSREYNFVYGGVADSNISLVINKAKSGLVTYDEFVELIKPYDQYNQDQLSFHTNESLKCLTLSGFSKITKEASICIA